MVAVRKHSVRVRPGAPIQSVKLIGERTERFKDATNNAGGGGSFRPHSSFHIPLAEQIRRRPAKPQRLVQFQHGIPILPNQPEGHESPITVIAIVRRRGLMSHSR